MRRLARSGPADLAFCRQRASGGLRKAERLPNRALTTADLGRFGVEMNALKEPYTEMFDHAFEKVDSPTA